MIITRTPYRVSFVGGGSDLPAFYSKSPGMVISTSIDQYMHILVHPNFNPNETKVKYSKIEVVKDIDDIEHPIVRAVLKKFNVHGIEITSVGDIPAGTGLGSSSCFTVGLLQAIHAYLGEQRTKEQLAKEACEIEIDLLKEPIGKQDQYAAACGGLNRLTFNKDGSVEVMPINVPPARLLDLQKSLLLFFTGATRSASGVLAEQGKNITQDQSKNNILQKMVDMVPLLCRELEGGNIDSLGDYLHENWLLKRQLAAAISNPKIDQVYEKARRLGAVGGKILGAGGGGFFLFYCPPNKQSALIDGLGLQCLPVQFDVKGTQIVYNSDAINKGAI